MNLLTRLRSVTAALLGRNRFEERLADEIRLHIEANVDELVRAGMPRKEAERRARIEFGGVEGVREDCRQARGLRWLDELSQDFRYGTRLLAKDPSFAATAIVTLALGIGADTAIFSVVKAVLLEPLPYRQSDRLVHIIQNLPASQTIDARPRRVASMDFAEFFALREQSQTLAQVAAYDSPREITLSGQGEPLRLIGTPVSASLFPALGIQPFLGRAFTEDDHKPGAPRTVVLSYPAWQKYLAGNPKLLDRTVILDGRAHVVSGVMPLGFEFPDPVSEFWVPLDLTPPGPDVYKGAMPIARLRDGITMAAAAAEVRAVVGRVRKAYPPDRVSAPAELLEVLSIKDELVRPVRPALLVLLAAVGLVLLIACSNVANLMLARGAARRGELAVRAALGAGRARLIRQTLAESVLLGILGGTVGLFIADGGVRVLTVIAADTVPRLNGVEIDVTVLGFTFALSVCTSLSFGLVAAAHLSNETYLEAIKTRSTTRVSAHHRAHRITVIVETGLAVVLLIGSGLLIRSFVKLTRVDPGFDPGQLMMFQIALPQPLNLSALTDDVTREFESRLQSLPGVKSVAFTNAVPLVPRDGFTQPRFRGTPLPVQGQPEYREVSQNYFTTMRLRVLSGRSFLPGDGPGQPRVAVVNQSMARYFAGESPIGKTITLAGVPAEIVGIVNDIHDQALNVEPRPQVYLNSRQGLGPARNARALNWAYFVVRSDRGTESLIPHVRRLLKEMIPGAALRLNTADMERVVSRSIARPRLYALLLGSFAAAALLLAMIGVYGITNYSVVQRTREIGIRIAIGAMPHEVLSLALRQSLLLAFFGVACGLGGAFALTKYLEGMLFGLTPLDPSTFVVIPVAFALTALIAAYLPARRATRIDPLLALREE